MNFRDKTVAGLICSVAGMLLAASAQAAPVAGSTWTEPVTGVAFVWVPPGCMTIGAQDGRDNEKPAHKICTAGFYMSQYEVTQAQYEKVMGNNPSNFKGPQKPVEEVDWRTAHAYAEKLGKLGHNTIRLPSEAEWEYACRAGGVHDGYCGAGDFATLAWYSANSNDTTHDVGGKRPNAWGLYDMNGNVWEWTQDCYHSTYQGAPADGTAWMTGECDDKVTRGGGWNRDASRARAPYRGADGLGHRADNIGIRLAMSAQ